GGDPELRPRRGVVTGANEVLVIREAQAKLGGLAWIRAEGFHRAHRQGRSNAELRRFRGLVESSALVPLLRGSGVSAWRYRPGGYLLWVYDDSGPAAGPAPPHAARYLSRHEAVLSGRSGWRPGLPPGAVFRLSPETLRPKVAWQDLAEVLEAVALPATARGLEAKRRPLIPLNTVYFIPTDAEDRALLLAALLNSLPARTFARAVAERAKDARFRFQAWTVALLPLPQEWVGHGTAPRLLALSKVAHGRGVLSARETEELDMLVGLLYGLSPENMRELDRFDRWLRGAGAR
ncbi:MAG: hypothetical protein HY703_07340, partial [Gemmatimonadetes bacterium]|nr:hypothetical protein [Gemmatimonadota bacterium]